jgi:hypothetical protein
MTTSLPHPILEQTIALRSIDLPSSLHTTTSTTIPLTSTTIPLTHVGVSNTNVGQTEQKDDDDDDCSYCAARSEACS